MATIINGLAYWYDERITSAQEFYEFKSNNI